LFFHPAIFIQQAGFVKTFNDLIYDVLFFITLLLTFTCF